MVDEDGSVEPVNPLDVRPSPYSAQGERRNQSRNNHSHLLAIVGGLLPVMFVALASVAENHSFRSLDLVDIPTVLFAGFAIALAGYFRQQERGIGGSGIAILLLLFVLAQGFLATFLLAQTAQSKPSEAEVEQLRNAIIGPGKPPISIDQQVSTNSILDSLAHAAEPTSIVLTVFSVGLLGCTVLVVFFGWDYGTEAAKLAAK